MPFKWEKINTYASKIVENIDPESIDVYLFLSDQYRKGDVSTNYLFQFVFRSFYRIDNAGLTSEFKDKYFELMEEARKSQNLDLSYLSKELFKFPNKKGLNTLQFSFISKLANTVDASYPIFDSEISGLYGFKRPYNYKDFDVRLNEYLAFYSKLKSDYRKALKRNLLEFAMNTFEASFPQKEKPIPEIKKIDFLLWSAGKLKTSKDIDI